MLISRKVWEAERDARVRAEAVAGALQNQVATLTTAMDWQMMRLTQLEKERAQLIQRYMGITIAVPEVHQERLDSSATLQELPSFDDVGDKEAARLGIHWNDVGEVEYAGSKA